jgi:hypothetical protein
MSFISGKNVQKALALYILISVEILLHIWKMLIFNFILFIVNLFLCLLKYLKYPLIFFYFSKWKIVCVVYIVYDWDNGTLLFFLLFALCLNNQFFIYYSFILI